MPTPHEIAQALSDVTDRASLLQRLLADTLDWPIEGHVQAPEEISYKWTPDDLRAQNLEKHLMEGQVWQFQPFRNGQPWGVFLLEFTNGKIYRSVLRQVLRGLVPSRRRDPSLTAWHHENLLFLCTGRDSDRFTFAHFRGEKAANAKLVTF